MNAPLPHLPQQALLLRQNFKSTAHGSLCSGHPQRLDINKSSPKTMRIQISKASKLHNCRLSAGCIVSRQGLLPTRKAGWHSTQN
jgi:hypothetical protein